MKDGSVSNFGNAGKKDENRRTLTDFKIIGLEIPDLSWSWGVLPSSVPVKVEVKEEAIITDTSQVVVKEEHADANASVAKTEDTFVEETSQCTEVQTLVGSNDGSMDVLSAQEAKDGGAARGSDANLATPPPSRMRIYFHTPVTADDSKPIPHSSSFSLGVTPADSRKGKRKKLEDEDADLEEEARVPPPPPQMTIGDDRSSVAASAAPSVAETASEADWLMAAIEGEEEAETEIELHPGDEDEGEQLHVSQHITPEGTVNGASAGVAGVVVLDGELNLSNVTTTCFGVDNRPLDRHRAKRSPCAHTTNFSSFKGNVDVKMNDTSVVDRMALSIDTGNDSIACQDSGAPTPVNGVHDGVSSAAVNAIGKGDLTEGHSGAATVNGIVESQQLDGAKFSAVDAPSGSSVVVPSDSSDTAVSLQSQGAITVPSASASVFDTISVLHDVPHPSSFLDSDEHSADRGSILYRCGYDRAADRNHQPEICGDILPQPQSDRRSYQRR